jgi:hypothetical protein
MGAKGVSFYKHSGRTDKSAPDRMFRLFTPDGVAEAEKQLRWFGNLLPYVTRDGLDLTEETLMVKDISRHPNFPGLTSLYEELDVESPVFHPALWQWYEFSRPKDRSKGFVYRKALARHPHPAFRIPEAGVYKPIAPVKGGFSRAWVQDNPMTAALLRHYARLRPERFEGDAPRSIWIAPPYRSRKGLSLIEDGVSRLSSNPLIEARAVERAIQAFVAGDDRWIEVLLATASAGQWHSFVTNPELPPHMVRVVEHPGQTGEGDQRAGEGQRG